MITMSTIGDLINLIKEDERIMVAELMDDEMKKNVLQLEMKRLEELVPFINKGMEEAFEEKNAIVLVIDNTIDFEIDEDNDEYDEESTGLTLQTESGQIVGETIMDEDELEDLRDDPNVFFLSDNFVTYNNLAKPGEKQFFVMGSTSRHFFTNQAIEDLVDSITVAIPSTNTDHYIKDVFDLPHDAKIGTLIIGFTE
jgi:hypothetical protein